MWIEKFCSGDKNWLNKEEKKASIFGFRIAIPKPSLKWFNVVPDEGVLYSPKFDKSFFDSPPRSIWRPIHNKNNAPKIWTNENIFGELININLESKKIKHEPKKHDLLIFNSNLMHSVDKYYGKNDRIAVAWDAIYTF